MSEFRELCFIKAMRNVIYCLKVFQAKNCFCNNSIELNVRFSKYQKQSSGGVLLKVLLTFLQDSLKRDTDICGFLRTSKKF